MLQTAAAQPFGHVTVFVPVRLRLEMPHACESGQRRRTSRASVDPTHRQAAERAWPHTSPPREQGDQAVDGVPASRRRR